MPAPREQPDSHDERGDLLTPGRIAVQWFCLLGPLAAAFLQQQLAYAFVTWACARQLNALVHVPSALALALTAAAGLAARREWQRGGRHLPTDEPGALGSVRFFAAVGFVMTGLAAALILAQWLPTLFISPCQR